MGDKQAKIYADQDKCLVAIEDGRAVPARYLAELPPWRAVLIGRVAERAGVPLEDGTVEELVFEAKRVGGEGKLVWPIRAVRTPSRSQDLHGP